MRTDEELKKIAMDIVDDKIFTSDMVRNPSEIGMVFMPVLLGGLKDMDEDKKKDVRVLFEYYSEAMPRGINGYPTFPSVQILFKEEVPIIQKYVDKYVQLKEYM